MEKVFLFDLDDTLMWNEYTYSLAFIEFYEFLEAHWQKRLPYVGSIARLAEDLTHEMVNEINPATGKPFGFAMERFPTSLVRCYQRLCEMGYGTYTEGLASLIYEIGLTAFDPRNYQAAGLVPGAKGVLDFLKEKKDKLILVTKGDLRVQRPKIEALELSLWFPKIHIVESKPPELFAKFRKKFRGHPIFSVGNSFSSDIKTALEAGVKGIFIPYFTWKAESIDPGAYDPAMLFTLKEIGEITKYYQKGAFDH